MKRIIPVIIILAAIGGGYWWFNQPSVAAPNPAAEPASLLGSGTIEAETVAITAELGGRIIELKVDEGDEVEAGQVLVELDKADLLAQRAQLEAVVATAETNLVLVSAPARPEDIAMARAELTRAGVTQDGAELTWIRARELTNDPHELEAEINRARAQVTEAERNLEMAKVNLKRMEIQAEAASRNQSNHEGLVQNEVAQHNLQAAQVGVEMAEVALAGAEQQVEHLLRLRDRPLQLIAQANAAEAAYQQAGAAVLAAEANLAAVEAGPMPEDITVAQAQILEAEAALAAVEVQLAKQTLTAPRDGLISQKLVNPGELAVPVAVLLELSDIGTVDLTVYIPETRIGQVKIGQKALVYVDAYEGETFEGLVSFIAHEAEFTPRNVQTQEERVNLVFAVKITLDNAGHRLKPGMPADAEILTTDQSGLVEAQSPTTLPKETLTPTAMPMPTNTPTTTPTPFGLDATPTATSTPTEASPTVQAEIIAWGLKVRSGPGVDYPALGHHLAQGDVVPVIEVDPDTGWLQIQLPDAEETGWITGSPTYVSIR
jgi:multidrug resistance efflux pump